MSITHHKFEEVFLIQEALAGKGKAPVRYDKEHAALPLSCKRPSLSSNVWLVIRVINKPIPNHSVNVLLGR